MASSNHAPGTVFEECPACAAKVWDNREKIESGEWSAKSPHFACSDKTGCGWVSWPERDKKGARKATSAPKGYVPTPTIAGRLTPSYSFADLVALHKACYKAVAYCKTDRVAAAATVFIACTNKGVGPPENMEDMPKALKEEKDDLPFDDDPGMEE